MMNETAKDKLGAIALGALGGGVAAFVVWQVMRVQVDQQVQTTIDREVAAEMDRKFADIGLTPAVAANLRTLMTNLDALGTFAALAQGTAPRR